MLKICMPYNLKNIPINIPLNPHFKNPVFRNITRTASSQVVNTCHGPRAFSA